MRPICTRFSYFTQKFTNFIRFTSFTISTCCNGFTSLSQFPDDIAPIFLYFDIFLRYVDIFIFFPKPHLDIECQVLLAASSCVHSFNRRMRIENEDNDEDDDGDDDELSL